MRCAPLGPIPGNCVNASITFCMAPSYIMRDMQGHRFSLLFVCCWCVSDDGFFFD